MKRYLESFLTKEALSQFIKVGIVGVANTVVSFALFNLFLWIGWWSVLAVSVAFEFGRWLRIEWLPETLVIVGTATVLLARRETTWRCALYGALCGAIGFSAGTLVVALIHPSRYATPLAELIFLFVPVLGATMAPSLGPSLGAACRS